MKMSKWYKCEFYNHKITFVKVEFAASPEAAREQALKYIEETIDWDVAWDQTEYEETITELDLERA